MPAVDLGGTFQAAPAEEHLRRAFHTDDFDDSGWEAIEVPGHWRSTPAFAECDGPLLHRRSFEAATTDDQRWWLELDGLFYQGDVWLDGNYVGDTEGYFVPHLFEVTEQLQARREHHLAIEVTCAPQTARTSKRNLTGVFQHWDCLDPDWNPGGIWRPVRLRPSGPVRITRLRAICREASAERAVVAFDATFDAATATTACVRTTIGALDHETTVPLATGTNAVSWTVTIDRPERWWPHALGDPVLHDVTVVVTPEDQDGAADERRLRIGLREVRLRDWVASVNGERLFLKGSNHGPTRMALAEATPDELRRDVALAREANLDLLRIHAHVTRPELYDAADEAGLLLWQDFPMQWGYARGVRGQARRQAAAMVDLLGHHPSIAIWCGHNEPMAIDIEPGRLESTAQLAATGLRALAAQQLPTWNKTILDRSVRRAIEGADPSRPVIPHSGVLPHLPTLDGTDSHLYFGWYWGEERAFAGFTRLLPRMARFVTEFGAQAVPEDAAFCEPDRWPDLDWERLERGHALQRRFFDRYVPPAESPTFDAWRTATQHYQAEVVRHHVEHLRRLKYRPTGGFAQFCFADGHPAITWSVLGHDRAPKAGFAALRDACRPLIVVADRLPATLRPGQAVALDVHVVSDLRAPIERAEVRAEARWDGGTHRWAWTGAVPADSCVRVGTVRFVAPDSPGPLRLELRCTHDGDDTSNEYETRVEPTTP